MGAVYRSMAEVPLFRYGMIMADPPWTYELRSEKGQAKAPQAKYDCMSIDEIKALRVGDLAAPNCALWLWCTNPILPLGFEVMKAWGFRYVTAGHWVKRTPKGKLRFGTGYCLRSAGEPFLIGAIGRPEYTKSTRSIVDAVSREHSRKPDEAFDAAARLLPGVRRIELFSRQVRPGWDAMGDQVELFEPTEEGEINA